MSQILCPEDLATQFLIMQVVEAVLIEIHLENSGDQGPQGLTMCEQSLLGFLDRNLGVIQNSMQMLSDKLDRAR